MQYVYIVYIKQIETTYTYITTKKALRSIA